MWHPATNALWTVVNERDELGDDRPIFVPFRAGEPSGPPEEVLTGFVDERGEARGRPVGVAIDRTGALLVADDVGNCVWRATPELSTRMAEPRERSQERIR